MDDLAPDSQPERLTRREREVGELLRRGLTNEEIAVRLGISLDRAKYHVSQILSKIGVATREEAAQALAAPKSRRQWTAWPLVARLVAASLAAVTVVGVTLLAVGVLLTSGSHDTSLAHPTGTLQAYVVPSNEPIDSGGQLPIVAPGSDKLEFPAYLSSIPGIFRGSASPDDIAFAPNGDLWITWIGSDGAIVLARNPAGTATVSDYKVPAARQTTHVRVAFDESGRAVVAFGDELTLVDPRTLAYKTIELPSSTATPEPGAPFSVPDTVSTLRVQGETAFVGDFDSNAIKQVSLDSGQVSNVAIPSSFPGPLDDFAVTPARIWLLKTGDGPVGQSEIGILDRASGNVKVVQTRVRSAGVYGDGLVAVTWEPDGIVRVDPGGATQAIESDTLTSSFLGQLGVELPIATDGHGGVWLSDITAKSIVWLDPSTGAGDVYALPVWQTSGPISCPPMPPPGNCGPAEIFTQITATVVSPEGDLYFADATMNRVGEIHRP
jgi:DNA-binding CsgD family transcriptional regulator